MNMKNKNRLLALFAGLMMLGACTQEQMITDLPEDEGTEAPVGKATTFKRGCGFSTGTSTGQWWANLVNLKANWYYTWGLTGCQDPYAPQNVEFVPQFWGHSNVTQSNIDMVNELFRQNKIFYVLGFNEPDLKEEANMSVEQALDDWEVLCQKLDPGIKLVSPVPAWPTSPWLNDFMKGAQARGLRVDYIALHLYSGPSPSTYSNQVKNIYKNYGKKIWITEFAPRHDGASSSGNPEDNTYTEKWIHDSFIKTVLTDYESMDEVFRYAWFSGSPTMAGLWTSMLVDKEGKLTSLGEYYATINPNNDIAPAKGVAMPQ